MLPSSQPASADATDGLGLLESELTDRLLQRSDCLVSFDHHGPDFARDPASAFNALRRQCPITWSETHGGHWIVTGYAEAFAVLQDDTTFSSADGVSIPPLKKKGPPIDVDPPIHREYRKALGPATSPKGVSKLAGQVKDWTREAIESVIETGRADLVTDLAAPVPAKAIMVLLGLDLANWRRYAAVWHDLFAHPLDSRVYQGLEEIRSELREAFARKHSEPADDLMSHLWSAPLFDHVRANRGEGFSALDEGTEIAMTMLGAGVDTTTNTFASTAIFLSDQPNLRDRLRKEPELMERAVDEFLRYFSTAPALARTVTRDLEFFGHDLHVGDRVLVSFMAANHDPKVFERPDEVVIDCWPNRHMAFGVGNHRCAGSNLARLVFPIMLTGLLEALPDYRVIYGDLEMYADRGQVTGWSRVPCLFTPRSARVV
jgi:cytochrome P450